MSVDFEVMRARKSGAPAVVLLSGGLDSATVLAIAKKHYIRIFINFLLNLQFGFCCINYLLYSAMVTLGIFGCE